MHGRSAGTLMTNAEELKSSGLKATLPRIKILEVFQHTTRRHMTAEDVYKSLLIEGSDIGLATVYRVLMQFEQAGLLTRSNFESGKSVFELNEGHHHDHLVCLTCGRVEEFYDPEIEVPPARRGRVPRLRPAGPLAGALRPLHQDRLPPPHPLTTPRHLQAGAVELAPPGRQRRPLGGGGRRPLRGGRQSGPPFSIARWWRSMNSW
jgi:Fur family ferric uptake transcriptional regulator